MLDAARAQTRVGARETEIAAALAAIPLAVGGECAFEPTVIRGLDDPVPIRRSTLRTLGIGDSVMVDVGAAVQGYQGDATRTFVLGTPSSAQLAARDVVRRAYEAALNLACPGVPCKELHRVSGEIIEGAGFTVAQRIGHGIGRGERLRNCGAAARRFCRGQARLERRIAIACRQQGYAADLKP
jgi:Xaa-Pro aminopeptidase